MSMERRFPVRSRDEHAAVVINSICRIVNEGISNPYPDVDAARSHAEALLSDADALESRKEQER